MNVKDLHNQTIDNVDRHITDCKRQMTALKITMDNTRLPDETSDLYDIVKDRRRRLVHEYIIEEKQKNSWQKYLNQLLTIEV